MMMPSKDTANSHTKQHQWAGNKLGRAAVEITCIGYNSTAVIEQHIQLLHILYMSSSRQSMWVSQAAHR